MSSGITVNFLERFVRNTGVDIKFGVVDGKMMCAVWRDGTSRQHFTSATLEGALDQLLLAEREREQEAKRKPVAVPLTNAVYAAMSTYAGNLPSIRRNGPVAPPQPAPPPASVALTVPNCPICGAGVWGCNHVASATGAAEFKCFNQHIYNVVIGPGATFVNGSIRFTWNGAAWGAGVP